ncbi:MAG: glycosyltransferase [Muribaculaceae bacterium]
MSTTSSSNIKVSVIVLTYNQSKYLNDALQSIIHQRVNFNYEIVVGDDCSTNSTTQLLLQWQQKYPDIIKLHFSSKNQGLLPNFIRTFNACKGQYIAICEGDDYWTNPNKLQLQADFLDNNPSYSTCIHRVVNYYEDNNTKSLSNGKQKAHNTIVDLAKSNFITNVSAMFRANRVGNLPSWFEGVGTYDYALHMLNAADGDIYYMSRPMAVYRKHAGAIWSVNGRRSQLLLSMQVREHLLRHFASANQLVLGNLLQSYLACAAALAQTLVKQNQQQELAMLTKRVNEFSPDTTTQELLAQSINNAPTGLKRIKQLIIMALKMARSLVSKLIPAPKPA